MGIVFFFCNFQTLCHNHKEKARKRALRSNGIHNQLQHQGGWSSGCTWLGTKLFATASYYGAKIILKEPHSNFTVFFEFYLFFSKLSICEIGFMGAKAVFNRNQIRLQKYLNPFCIPTRKSSNKYKGKEKPLGKAEKSCHNGLISFLKLYFIFRPLHCHLWMVFCYHNCSDLLWEKFVLV